jgi:hypothetical protein
MKKKIILAASTLAITAGSVLAFANTGAEPAVARTSTEQCPPECCNGNGDDCGPDLCRNAGEECCEK